MKKYLLFDLDGTLTDPKIGITTCVQYALHSFGIEEPDLDKLEPFIGPPLRDSFMEFHGFTAEQAEEAVAKYRERFQNTGIFENEVYAGIPEMLKNLQSKGYFLALASSKPQIYVERILEHFDLKKYFAVVVGSELDGTRETKDQVVQETLHQLFKENPIEPDQVYMIGDRKFDVEGARALGVESVGVTYGYGSKEELKEAKADYIVQSVEELEKFLLRGSEELVNSNPDNKKKNPMYQRIWTMVYSFLMFILVRNAVQYALLALLYQLAQSGASGGLVDLLIPRGGKGLIRACVENASVPCIETGTGICHVYVDRDADLNMAVKIIENAKTSRPSVCNAEEVCLVHRVIAKEFLPKLKAALVDKRREAGLVPVELRLDEAAAEIIPGTAATELDFDTEFLDYILAVAVVDDLDAAIAHVQHHSTHHSDCIVTENQAAADRFVDEVDSAAVYVNVSTRFTDGGEFGLGCEMGISTQKLHARGPMGLDELSTYKYVITGSGQIR